MNKLYIHFWWVFYSMGANVSQLGYLVGFSGVNFLADRCVTIDVEVVQAHWSELCLVRFGQFPHVTNFRWPVGWLRG
jgi:hypothetical protein